MLSGLVNWLVPADMAGIVGVENASSPQGQITAGGVHLPRGGLFILKRRLSLLFGGLAASRLVVLMVLYVNSSFLRRMSSKYFD